MSISLVVLLVVASVPDTVLVSMLLMVLLVVLMVLDTAPVLKVVVSRAVEEGITPPGKEGEVEGMVERLGSG